MSSSKFSGIPQDSESESEVNFAQEVGSDNDAESDAGVTRGGDNTSSKQQRSQDMENEGRDRHIDNTGDDEEDGSPSTNNNTRPNQSNPRSVPDEDGEDDDEGDDNEEAAGGRNDGENNDGDDGDDDEDDDDDEDEDEDEQVQSHRRKRQKKNRRNQFIDVEAEVDEDEDDADEDEDELPPGFVADDEPPEDGDAEGDDRDDRRHRELDQRRQEEENLSAEQLAAKLQDRYSGYGRNRAAAADATILPQRMLLPSVEDPTIWGVRVKPGKEREVVFAVTRRIELQMFSPQPLAITAAFERGGTMAGYVYVEARRQADVMVALEGLPSAYPRTNMVRVPIQEMPDLLRVTKTKMLEPGMYVRIKRGKYQGDLAQVEEVEANGLEVECRLVPREDYGLNEDARASMSANMSPQGKRKRPPPSGKNSVATRPPQRLFNEHEARKKNGRYLQQVDAYKSKHFNYMGNVYIAGFLHKSFRVQLLQTENVNPTLEEVTKFTASAEDGTENLDLAALAATLKSSTATDSYLPGDKVEIAHGEQRGVIGKAISVHGDIVTLRVTEGDLAGQTLESPVKSLNKIFKEGDHVKVIGGSKYQDEVGMVVRVKDGRVTILSDSSNQEITVFSKDLRASTEAGVVTSGSQYDLFDLVQLDPATVACIIKVDRESLKVLDQNGAVRSLLPSNISNKLERRRFAVTTDKDGTEIRNDDTVKEAAGDQRQGRVMHIHRSYLFIQNRQQNENAGIFVARSSSVLTVAAKAGRGNNAGPDLSKMNPNTQRNGVNGGAGATANAMPPPKPIGRDRMMGKSCKIKKGQYKGLLGIVKDTTDSHARIELHSKSKTVTVPKDSLNLLDAVTGQPLDMNKFGGSRPPPVQNGAPRSNWGSATPARVPEAWDGGRTPMNGGKTPAWSAAANSGGRTPGWKQSAPSGGRTPAAWNDGSRTANPYGDGNRTAYGGGTGYGGATWNPNASTPFHSSSAFQSGSRTPAAWDVGNRTPANQNYNAPNSGFSAQTPGASGDYEDYASLRNPYGSVPAGSSFGAFNTRAPGATFGDTEEGYE